MRNPSSCLRLVLTNLCLVLGALDVTSALGTKCPSDHHLQLLPFPAVVAEAQALARKHKGWEGFYFGHRLVLGKKGHPKKPVT